MVQLEGLSQLKNPMSSSGIEPMTFQFTAQCLNRLHYVMPSYECFTIEKWLSVAENSHILSAEMRLCKDEL
jgi:hypothetical protein